MTINREKIIIFLATGFGISPYAPHPGRGTVGSLAALLVYLILPGNIHFYWPFLVLFTAAAVYISGEAEKILGEKDPAIIVIDEFAGVFLSLAFLPKKFGIILLGMVIFRVLDGLKVYPINLLETKLKGGLAVVADDLAAGLATNIVMNLLYLIF
ncbi:MAG TPA: phosphatidylglycerophosphatase A [bacterium]|nr:phosphatidylglycerophosphatase A [bacterium]